MADPIQYAIKWAVAMIIVASIGIYGLSLYINMTATGSDEMTNANSAVLFIVGTIVILFACLGLALAFMPPELKSKVGLFVQPQAYFADPKERKRLISIQNNFEWKG